jgi:hypothetical protein|tara:strand:+ start:2713 stop:3408 length:696 start_codon:yes stop_codon:yes gene_type:complete
MAERITRKSCPLCNCEQRDQFEEDLQSGISVPKQLDKDMGWREGTSDRHFRNHMGEYHMGSNSECVVCTSDERQELEFQYLQEGMPSADVAAHLECSESTVYHHMKHHLKPIVKASAAPIIALAAGEEIEQLRKNAERLNGELGLMLDDADRNDPQYVRNLTGLSKEVRETVKDIIKIQEHTGLSDAQTTMKADTINILKIELAKESPEVWRRVRQTLMTQNGEVGEVEEI